MRRAASALGLLLLLNTQPFSAGRGGPPWPPIPGRHTGPPQPASIKEVLRLSAAWVERFADDMTFVVADERYEQEYRVKEGASTRVERRRLLSEIVFVRTPEEEQRAGYPWVQFRDVVEVDGVPLAEHRGRLERLFRESSDSSYAQASAMIAESARYNIGPGVRTVNLPCFPLFFLTARNQPRFKFKLGRAGEPGGLVGLGQVGQIRAPCHSLETTASPRNPPGVVAVEYRERDTPTMIRSPHRENLPASGVFYIDAATGRVLETRLDVTVDRSWVNTIEVTYGHDTGTDAWVPLTMHERAGRPEKKKTPAGDETLDCTATYTNFRRFRTDAHIVR